MYFYKFPYPRIYVSVELVLLSSIPLGFNNLFPELPGEYHLQEINML